MHAPGARRPRLRDPAVHRSRPRPAIHRQGRATHHDGPGDKGQGELPLHPRRLHRDQGALRLLLPVEGEVSGTVLRVDLPHGLRRSRQPGHHRVRDLKRRVRRVDQQQRWTPARWCARRLPHERVSREVLARRRHEGLRRCARVRVATSSVGAVARTRRWRPWRTPKAYGTAASRWSREHRTPSRAT